MTTPIDPIREALPVVAWRYTHKGSGADCASTWRWTSDWPGREVHDEDQLVRLSDAEAAIAAVTKAKDAEIAEWKKLLDPAVLHANLNRGIPAKLTREQLLHLLGDDAEIEALRADAERYRWLRDKDDSTFDTGMNARHWDAAIDAALKEPS